MRNNLNLILVLFFLSVTACNFSKKSKLDNPATSFLYLSDAEISKLKYKVEYNGDTTAYKMLFSDYVMKYNIKAFYYYSMIMFNKYKYPRGAFDVYIILTNGLSRDSLQYQLDSTTYNIAIDYLKLSSSNGFLSATQELELIQSR